MWLVFKYFKIWLVLCVLIVFCLHVYICTRFKQYLVSLEEGAGSLEIGAEGVSHQVKLGNKLRTSGGGVAQAFRGWTTSLLPTIRFFINRQTVEPSSANQHRSLLSSFPTVLFHLFPRSPLVPSLDPDERKLLLIGNVLPDCWFGFLLFVLRE